jgi:S-DNA-T family DNA segregation ATPase FtsK/SpoIIIE
LTSSYVCPQCGLDYDSISKADAAVAARSFPRRFAEQLHRAEDDESLLRRQPEPGVWSPLEYTAHVRDMFDLMADTVSRMRREDKPSIAFPDPDERAARERYNDQPVHDVLAGLEANAARFADVIDSVSVDDLARTAVFPWGERDVLTMIRNGVHEGKHHLRDVELVLERLGVPRP